jgi:hypothetical protein
MVEVNGWLSPYWAKIYGLQIGAGIKREDIPKELQTYAEYISLLDLDEYRKTKNPLQYAIMAFALDNLLMKQIKINNPNDIIRVYKSGIGLEERALPLLKGYLKSDQAMQLYNEYRDARLLDVLPVPKPEDEKYIQFLLDLTDKEPNKGWCALELLYKMDDVAYRERFRDFLVCRVQEMGNMQDRMGMYRALAEIGDDKSIGSLAISLLSDPLTEGREAILHIAMERKVCSGELVDSVTQILRGLGEKHRAISLSRMKDQWHHSLEEYLIWTRDNSSCDDSTRRDAEHALELLDG